MNFSIDVLVKSILTLWSWLQITDQRMSVQSSVQLGVIYPTCTWQNDVRGNCTFTAGKNTRAELLVFETDSRQRCSSRSFRSLQSSIKGVGNLESLGSMHTPPTTPLLRKPAAPLQSEMNYLSCLPVSAWTCFLSCDEQTEKKGKWEKESCVSITVTLWTPELFIINCSLTQVRVGYVYLPTPVVV